MDNNLQRFMTGAGAHRFVQVVCSVYHTLHTARIGYAITVASHHRLDVEPSSFFIQLLHHRLKSLHEGL